MTCQFKINEEEICNATKESCLHHHSDSCQGRNCQMNTARCHSFVFPKADLRDGSGKLLFWVTADTAINPFACPPVSVLVFVKELPRSKWNQEQIDYIDLHFSGPSRAAVEALREVLRLRRELASLRDDLAPGYYAHDKILKILAGGE